MLETAIGQVFGNPRYMNKHLFIRDRASATIHRKNPTLVQLGETVSLLEFLTEAWTRGYFQVWVNQT